MKRKLARLSKEIRLLHLKAIPNEGGCFCSGTLGLADADLDLFCRERIPVNYQSIYFSNDYEDQNIAYG